MRAWYVASRSNREADGGSTALYSLARSLCLAGAGSASIMAVDSVYTDFRNDDGLRTECEEAVRDGFVAKMAIHPAQVAAINEIFTPSPEAIRDAKAIVRLLAEAGDSGVASLNGKMIDRPHLRSAERLLARARAAGLSDSV